MSKKRRTVPYQYEPLVTPAGWKDDELRFSVRLTQLLDDLYQKYSALKAAQMNGVTDEPTEEPSEPGLTMAEVISAIYPVGSIYISVNSISPAELFGGTWERIKDTFLLAAGDVYSAGATGGEAEHKLTEAELPAVSGSFATAVIPQHGSKGVKGNAYGDGFGVIGADNAYGITTGIAGTSITSGGQYGYGFKFGSDQSHNNMPPYLVVYAWRRTV